MLSTRTRYSIVALCDITQASGTRGSGAKAGPVSLVDIADKHSLSLCYLEQLAVKWRRAGFVKGVRGPSGGYLLCQDPGDISVADIAVAMDEAVSCPDADGADQARIAGCPAQKILDMISAQVLGALAAISLADIAGGKLDEVSSFPVSLAVSDTGSRPQA